jgi:hypothetical protein
MSSRTLGLTLGAVAILGGVIYLAVQAASGPAPATAVGDHPAPTTARPHTVLPGPALAMTSGETTEAAGGPEPATSVRPGPQAPPELLERARGFASGGAAAPPALDPRAAKAVFQRGDPDPARTAAMSVIAMAPEDVAARRTLVESACARGDAAGAKKHALALSSFERGRLVEGCRRNGVEIAVTGDKAPAPPVKPLVPTSDPAPRPPKDTSPRSPE